MARDALPGTATARARAEERGISTVMATPPEVDTREYHSVMLPWHGRGRTARAWPDRCRRSARSRAPRRPDDHRRWCRRFGEAVQREDEVGLDPGQEAHDGAGLGLAGRARPGVAERDPCVVEVAVEVDTVVVAATTDPAPSGLIVEIVQIWYDASEGARSPRRIVTERGPGHSSPCICPLTTSTRGRSGLPCRRATSGALRPSDRSCRRRSSAQRPAPGTDPAGGVVA